MHMHNAFHFIFPECAGADAKRLAHPAEAPALLPGQYAHKVVQAKKTIHVAKTTRFISEPSKGRQNRSMSYGT